MLIIKMFIDTAIYAKIRISKSKGNWLWSMNVFDIYKKIKIDHTVYK